MRTLSKAIIISAAALQLWQFAALAFAQESASDGVESWRALDEDFRQAIVEVISARRGLDPNDQNPDWLIRSAEDIAEALRVSCDLSGACADADGLSTLGENLISFPDYDEEQGVLNAEMIRRMKSVYEN